MHNESPAPLVLPLDDTSATLELVGGKGASLARLAAAGLPVPPGFHVTTTAYRLFVTENNLQEQILATLPAVDDPVQYEMTSKQIAGLFAQGAMPAAIVSALHDAYQLLAPGTPVPVAVRSSATAEDLPEMSFAGQQESYLNMHGESMVLDAIKRCWASLWTARAIAYRARHHIASQDVSLAVVVQSLVPADAAGVLFTADPLTGARDQVTINATWGLGESLVSGQVTPDTLIVDRKNWTIIQQAINEKTVMTVRSPDGTREEPVPEDQRTRPVLSPAQAAELARIGARIELLYDQPMDVEWTLHDGRFFIVQARPITTLHAQNPAPQEWNDSLAGDFLWTSGNLGEAVPDVMTPCSWSLIQIFMGGAMPITSLHGYPLIGNIGGRFYMNLSLLATVGAAFGMSTRRFNELNETVFGRVPDGVETPLIPIPRWRLLREILPVAIRLQMRIRVNLKRLPAFLETAQSRCEQLHAQIQATTSPAALIALWRDDLEPFFHECCHMLEAGARRDGGALMRARLKVSKLVGEADANAILSGQSQLESLGPLLSLSRLARGEIDRATFARQYGHRSSHEFEISFPRPAEDPDWIEQQLAGLREAPADADTLLARQKEAQVAAWQRFRQRYPRKVTATSRQIERASAAFRDREAARSEVIRVFWVLRAFVLRASELTGKEKDLFFLSIDEILALLGGDDTSCAAIPARRAAYERYCALPSYPRLIRGHFDPFKWAADPRRNNNVFDATGSQGTPIGDAITGFAGSAGIIEGRVRVISSPEQGGQLQPGEILVTTVTNIGWT
ncbi:MAG: pyruvate, phosphate dikinase, partial [Ktedonobacteraceae bacterium]|nr:pyruvate, phosphate dikinase [Ktedonobacteraceae bacterium]